MYVLTRLLTFANQFTAELATAGITISSAAADLLDLVRQLRRVPSDLLDAITDDLILLSHRRRTLSLIYAQQQLLVLLLQSG